MENEQRSRSAIISADTVFDGEIRNCATLEVYGTVKGTITAEAITIHQGGHLHGTIQANDIDTLGELQGDVTIKNLFQLRSSGQATGNIRYGRITVEDGAQLSAEVRNVPPELQGDFYLTVKKGQSARITASDVTAIDPDDPAQDLKFTVSDPTHGQLVLSDAPTQPITQFTQQDLETGRVLFSHDGTAAPTASFAVVVADASGATSGAAKTVQVAVQ